MKKTNMIGMMALFVVGMVLSAGAVSAYRGDYSVEGPNYTPERHTEMEQAFEDMDYESWYNLMTEDGRHPRVVDVVNEDNFDLFIQAHDAGKSGDSETAAAIRVELGLNNGMGPKDGTGFRRGMGAGRGMHNGQGLHDGTGNGRI
jgi:hypothetical protein